MGPVTTDGSLQDTHVLIAHPDERARGALRAVLERAGCTVAEAGSGHAALAAARRWCPDVLLLHADLGAALGEIKGDPDLFRIAVVLVGEPSALDAALDAVEHGAHDLLRADATAGGGGGRGPPPPPAQEAQRRVVSG